MKHPLENPVYNALLSGDSKLSYGTDYVKFFDEQVSPFAGFNHAYEKGFSDLYDMLPAGRKILYANPVSVAQPERWMLTHEIKGLQFIYDGAGVIQSEFPEVTALSPENTTEMMQLAQLTKPGPFGTKTILFGSYFGIFRNNKLVAMTGQRLHVENYTEISAVCTHPDFSGNGFAYILLQHQLQIILRQGQQPFLHVRKDNERAISLYRRLGFVISRPMNFYFFKKQ